MKKPIGMVKVRCECGDEILLLPDLKEIGKAIDDHVDIHLQNLKVPRCTPADAERLRDALITQVLRVASQSQEDANQ
jgi:hypothetical protein